jgi:hypothetical protein
MVSDAHQAVLDSGLEPAAPEEEEGQRVPDPPAPPAVATPSCAPNLELRLDQHATTLRRDLVQLFADARRQQEQEGLLLLQRERAAGAAHLTDTQRQLEAARVQLARLQESFRRQTAMLSRSVRWRVEMHGARRAWQTWRERVDARRRVAEGARLAARHYDMGKLQAAAFRLWRADAHEGLRARVRPSPSVLRCEPGAGIAQLI